MNFYKAYEEMKKGHIVSRYCKEFNGEENINSKCYYMLKIHKDKIYYKWYYSSDRQCLWYPCAVINPYDLHSNEWEIPNLSMGIKDAHIEDYL